MRRFVVITGPTATGKTAIAVRVAQALGSDIISADSMQIYRGMDIGTAKAAPEEMGGVVHHQIDIAGPDEDYSVAQFQQAAFAAIDAQNARGLVPVVAGGTGLYVNSLVYALDFSQTAKNQQFRQKYQQLADDKGVGFLYNILKIKDPSYAHRIADTDLRRIVRRLEIIESSGAVEYDFRRFREDADICIFGLTLPRDVLYSRTDARVDAMMAAGLAEEAAALFKRYGDVPALRAIGYKEMIGFFRGEYDEREAVRLIKRNTRRFAKRQMTWFKKDERIRWLDVQSFANPQAVADHMLIELSERGFICKNQ